MKQWQNFRSISESDSEFYSECVSQNQSENIQSTTTENVYENFPIKPKKLHVEEMTLDHKSKISKRVDRINPDDSPKIEKTIAFDIPNEIENKDPLCQRGQRERISQRKLLPKVHNSGPKCNPFQKNLYNAVYGQTGKYIGKKDSSKTRGISNNSRKNTLNQSWDGRPTIDFIKFNKMSVKNQNPYDCLQKETQHKPRRSGRFLPILIEEKSKKRTIPKKVGCTMKPIRASLTKRSSKSKQASQSPRKVIRVRKDVSCKSFNSTKLNDRLFDISMNRAKSQSLLKRLNKSTRVKRLDRSRSSAQKSNPRSEKSYAKLRGKISGLVETLKKSKAQILQLRETIHILQKDKADLVNKLEYLQAQKDDLISLGNLSNSDLRDKIESVVYEERNFGLFNNSHDKFEKLAERLEKLRKSQAFQKFLKINELDPSMFFGTQVGIQVTESTPDLLGRRSDRSWNNLERIGYIQHSKSMERFPSFRKDDLNLSQEEYFNYCYILARRLEKEEYERLQTEEQFQNIIEKLIRQNTSIEERERSMRGKLKEVIDSFDS
ncbi:unnamed protein product [Moneuplotes crassus]|uniref:Uncharacterized protein n=1 Tax=Euplotes crassus TaxID=5936 RepID=A0AAD1U5G5_EUPCR|nr:unnamed protein product [Moneuplotes crassus]